MNNTGWSGWTEDVLYLLPDEVEDLKKTILSRNPNFTEDELDDCFDLCQQIQLKDGVLQMMRLDDSMYDGIFGSSYMLDDDGVELAGADSTGALPFGILVLSAEKPRTLFDTQYSSLEELETEYKSKLATYLPEDFDWRAHMAHIQYAEYLED